MAVDFLDDGLYEFLCVKLPECLLKIHNVTHHLCVDRNGVLHPLLYFKVSIMEEVFIGLIYGILKYHVVHTLGHLLGHSS